MQIIICHTIGLYPYKMKRNKVEEDSCEGGMSY